MIGFFRLHEAIENFTGHTIYCDLDGVLVDLERGVRDYLGMQASPGRLGILRGLVTMKRNNVDLVEFFENLPWTADGKRLWTYLLPYEPIILTGGGDDGGGSDIMAGKNAWVAKNLGLPRNKVIHESQKSKYAKPRSILIDDYDKNAKGFTEAGGIGIQHTSAADTISRLKDLIVGSDEPDMAVR